VIPAAFSLAGVNLHTDNGWDDLCPREGCLSLTNSPALRSTACGDDTSTLQGEVPVGPPDLWNPVLPEKDEARGIHVGQLVAAQALQLLKDSFVMPGVQHEQLQTRQLAEGETESPGGLFSQSVQEPSVGLRHNGQRRAPAARRLGEKAQGCPVIAVASIEERDEDPRVEKDDPGRSGATVAAGRTRPR